MQLFNLEIVTPHGEIFNNKVRLVSLPGSEGVFEVLAMHIAMVSQLSAGTIRIEHGEGDNEEIIIDGGYAQISDSKVIVLAHGAVYLGTKDSVTAQRIEAARDLLKSASLDSALVNSTLMKLESR